MIQAHQEINYIDNFNKQSELNQDTTTNSDSIGSSLASSPAPSFTDSNSSCSASSSPAKFAYSTPYVHNAQLSHFTRPNEYQPLPNSYCNRPFQVQNNKYVSNYDSQVYNYPQNYYNNYSNSFNDSCYQSRNNSYNFSIESNDFKQKQNKPVINSLHKFSIDAILAKPSNINTPVLQNLIKQQPIVPQQTPNESIKEKGKRRKRTSTNELETSSSNKRIRTIFTQEQLDKLEIEFLKQQYMVGSERTYLAQSLNLSESQVKIWFQNRRIKWRKTTAEEQQQNSNKMVTQKSSQYDDVDEDIESNSNLNDSTESYDYE